MVWAVVGLTDANRTSIPRLVGRASPGPACAMGIPLVVLCLYASATASWIGLFSGWRTTFRSPALENHWTAFSAGTWLHGLASRGHGGPGQFSAQGDHAHRHRKQSHSREDELWESMATYSVQREWA